MLVALGLLALAIATEVAATTSLPRTNGFRDPGWTVAVVGGYAFSVWLLALVVRQLPVSVTYAVWSGLGTAAVAICGALFLGEHWDWTRASALAMIVGGVILLNLTGAH